MADEKVFHGLAGEFVRAASPHTEADEMGVLATLLAMFGAAVNRAPHALVGNEEHPARLFVVSVGDTSKGRKGTAWAVARSVLEVADPEFMAGRVAGGFGSGESIIDAVATPTDAVAPHDTRLLISEPEFARLLKVAAREGSTVSTTIRAAWDGSPLQARSRTAGTNVAAEHHVAVVAHITLEELRARLSETESFNGFANRFLFVGVQRSKLLPKGGNVPDDVIHKFGGLLAERLQAARRVGRMVRTDAAEVLWEKLYYQMAYDVPGGVLSAVTDRDAAQCLRLSVAYALLDGSDTIDVPHVEAAWAFWCYCRASAEVIFGTASGNRVADKLLEGITAAGPAGLTFTQQSKLLGGNVRSNHLDAARKLLEDQELIVTRKMPGARGKACDVSFTKYGFHEFNEER